jgi:superfamily II DNA or RNA helicase
MPAVQVLRPGQIIRARGQSWVVHCHRPGAHGSVLDVRGRDADNWGMRTSFLLPCEPIERLPLSDAPRMVRPRMWRAVARSILAAATPSYDSLRSPARARLAVLPFQLEPVLAIVRGLTARVLIADEVGLGKTVQAGLAISELIERRPDARVLVVAPAGLRDQWQAELRERFALDSTLIDSVSIARRASHWNGNPWSIPGVVLASLDYVKRPEVVRALEALIWDAVVFDEAHWLAGRSDRATVASLLARRARAVIMLTATPHSGSDESFARLTSLGDVSNRFPLLVFRRTRRDVGLSSSRRTVSLRVRPTPPESEMHAALMAYARRVWATATAPGARLAMSVLTRRACSSAWSLARSLDTRRRLLGTGDQPDLLQMMLPFAHSAADDDEPVAELSSPGLANPYEEQRSIEHVLALARQAEARESKLLAVARLLRRAREPAIVFTEYRDTLHRLAHHLRDLAPLQLHGGLTGSERRDVLQQFVSGSASVLLATDAASEGLNLHRRCRLVINLELPWTPVRLEQRIGRVERLGQTRRVHAVHLLAASTCEEESVAVLLTRMRKVAGVLGGMRAAASEEQVAAATFGAEPSKADLKARLHDDVALPPGVAVGDLRAAAREEAARLEHVRALGHAHHEPADTRPSVTVLRRRAPSVNDWAYRLVFEDPELRPIWDTVIGVRDGVNVVPRSSGERRRWLASLETVVGPALASFSTNLFESFASTIHAPLALAVERERALAEDLRQHRARLATSLLQPGLFDRRAERAAAAQNVTLGDALDRCARRLAELAGHDRASLDRRLVFGVIKR